MIVRPYAESDSAFFRRIHAESKLDYRYPDLSSPLFIVKTVIERAGHPATLLAARLTAETYLMTSGTAKERLEDIELAQSAWLAELWTKGLDDVYCGVPRSVDRHFRRHMERLGWERGRKDWVNYFRNVLP